MGIKASREKRIAGATLNRRAALKALAASAATVFCAGDARADQPKKTGLGLVLYCGGIRRSHLMKATPGFDLYEPANFLAHCRQLAAGGAQLRLGVLDAGKVRAVRALAEQEGFYLEAIVSVPKERKDGERFEAEMTTAVAAGARAARTTIIPGRRYEYFDTLEMFRQYDAQARKSLELASPVAERTRLPLAVENHKDHRDDQRVALLQHISSEYVGACVDTGNSLALLEDPIETVEKLAPWAHCVHLKDQALRIYEEGFLLGDIPLGQGALDLKRMVAILRQKKPDIRFSLELITRDPLKIPCLTKKYWATLPDVPGSDLARTLRYAGQHAAENLQYIANMSLPEQLAREDANVRASLDYARDVLGI